MNIAMLVIDMQKCFLAEHPDQSRVQRTCNMINYVSSMLRQAGQTVIHIQDIESADEIPAEELAFTDAITMHESDPVIQKVYSNAFWKTELESTLRNRDTELLIISGQAAEHCVVFTYNGAIENGFTPVILQGGVASGTAGRVEALQADRPVISYPVIEALTSG